MVQANPCVRCQYRFMLQQWTWLYLYVTRNCNSSNVILCFCFSVCLPKDLLRFFCFPSDDISYHHLPPCPLHQPPPIHLHLPRGKIYPWSLPTYRKRAHPNDIQTMQAGECMVFYFGVLSKTCEKLANKHKHVRDHLEKSLMIYTTKTHANFAKVKLRIQTY